jgi:hypothetical protein
LSASKTDEPPRCRVTEWRHGKSDGRPVLTFRPRTDGGFFLLKALADRAAKGCSAFVMHIDN